MKTPKLALEGLYGRLSEISDDVRAVESGRMEKVQFNYTDAKRTVLETCNAIDTMENGWNAYSTEELDRFSRPLREIGLYLTEGGRINSSLGERVGDTIIDLSNLEEVEIARPLDYHAPGAGVLSLDSSPSTIRRMGFLEGMGNYFSNAFNSAVESGQKAIQYLMEGLDSVRVPTLVIAGMGEPILGGYMSQRDDEGGERVSDRNKTLTGIDDSGFFVKDGADTPDPDDPTKARSETFFDNGSNGSDEEGVALILPEGEGIINRPGRFGKGLAVAGLGLTLLAASVGLGIAINNNNPNCGNGPLSYSPVAEETSRENYVPLEERFDDAKGSLYSFLENGSDNISNVAERVNSFGRDVFSFEKLKQSQERFEYGEIERLMNIAREAYEADTPEVEAIAKAVVAAPQKVVHLAAPIQKAKPAVKKRLVKKAPSPVAKKAHKVQPKKIPNKGLTGYFTKADFDFSSSASSPSPKDEGGPKDFTDYFAHADMDFGSGVNILSMPEKKEHLIAFSPSYEGLPRRAENSDSGLTNLESEFDRAEEEGVQKIQDEFVASVDRTISNRYALNTILSKKDVNSYYEILRSVEIAPFAKTFVPDFNETPRITKQRAEGIDLAQLLLD